MPTNSRPLLWPLLAAVAALAGSPLLEIVTGQDALYLLWLAVLMAILWVAQRLNRREVGFVLGDGLSYLVAFAYVVGIIGLVVLGAWATHSLDLSKFSALTVARRISLNFLVTFVATLITEDGFFRGALWGSCERAGLSPARTIVWTSVAFGLWHLAVPFIEPDFSQPLAKVPQYVVGSTVFGIAMALLRVRSGSIVVPSACHGLWNATTYTLFGTGEKTGLLGVADHSIWDPERGYAGLILSIVAAAILWIWIRPASTAQVDRVAQP